MLSPTTAPDGPPHPAAFKGGTSTEMALLGMVESSRYLAISTVNAADAKHLLN